MENRGEIIFHCPDPGTEPADTENVRVSGISGGYSEKSKDHEYLSGRPACGRLKRDQRPGAGASGKNTERETSCPGSVPGRKTCKESGKIQNPREEKEELKERALMDKIERMKELIPVRS